MIKFLLTSAIFMFAAPTFAQTRVAVSMTSFAPFLTILLNGIKEEAERSGGEVELLTEDAQLDPAKQLNQVQNFVATGVDAIIVNAVDGGAVQVLKAAGGSMKDVVIAVIDATPDGLAAMQAGDLDIIVYQNATKQGEVSVQTAMKAAAG